MSTQRFINEFTLSTSRDDEMEIEDDGELIIIFHFYGEAQCQQRALNEDRKLMQWADSNYPYYCHILVGCNQQQAFDFARQHKLDGDCVLFDPTGDIAVTELLASPTNCWMSLLGLKVLYHGPADLVALQSAL